MSQVGQTKYLQLAMRKSNI